jgi:hypothetical protein
MKNLFNSSPWILPDTVVTKTRDDQHCIQNSSYGNCIADLQQAITDTRGQAYEQIIR